MIINAFAIDAEENLMRITMNKMCPTLPFNRLGPAVVLCSFLIAGCAGSPSEVRYDDRMKTYSANKYDKVSAHYIVRPGGRPDFQPQEGQMTSGCQSRNVQPPAPERADLQLVLDASDILFEFDKWVLRAEVVPELDQWAAYFLHNPEVTAEIDGHTDSVGSTTYNQTLSERRAEAVVNYLIKKGVEPNRFVTKGFGENQPAASNTTAEGRQMNRRVELKF